MEIVKFDEHFDKLTKALSSNGAFLVVQGDDEKTNIMTIGWATLGVVWSRPVMTVFVRPVRYTYELIERAKTFSVCVPEGEKLAKELMECGTKSGRDMDKANSLGLTMLEGKLKTNKIISQCKFFYEAKIIQTNRIDETRLNEQVINDFYPKRDFHSVYYGEVKHCYIN